MSAPTEEIKMALPESYEEMTPKYAASFLIHSLSVQGADAYLPTMETSLLLGLDLDAMLAKYDVAFCVCQAMEEALFLEGEDPHPMVDIRADYADWAATYEGPTPDSE
ncbi:hypothetical protein [Streptomyces sp. NPDC101393]|uniref:hypothetical protein n=1 Tax=Streptomyces sp. NPDC101393 TaxID=3366141 RepID=UPI00382F4CF7